MQRLSNLGFGLLPVILALGLTTIILLVVGAPPLEAYRNIVEGALESPDKMASVVTAAVPLWLCSAGLLITFAAGLWNIGVEGQIVAGALLATWLALNLTLPALLFIPLLLIAGMVGGRIEENVPADLTIIDPKTTWKVEAQAFASRGKNSLLDGEELPARVEHVMVEGQLVFSNKSTKEAKS